MLKWQKKKFWVAKEIELAYVFSRYLVLCLHLEINSERLFNNISGFS